MSTICFLLLAVGLQWDWNTEPHLGGYIVHANTEDKIVEVSIDVGKVSNYDADVLIDTYVPGTTILFTVTAYNTEKKEGLPTNEVSYTKPDAQIFPHTHTWDEITGKPNVFAPAPHTHVVPPVETSE